MGWLAWGTLLAVVVIRLLTRPTVKEDPLPRCFGDYPHRHGQTAAERSCHDCPHAHDCFETTPYFGA
jgi:hypothetical protein